MKLANNDQISANGIFKLQGNWKEHSEILINERQMTCKENYLYQFCSPRYHDIYNFSMYETI